MKEKMKHFFKELAKKCGNTALFILALCLVIVVGLSVIFGIIYGILWLIAWCFDLSGVAELMVYVMYGVMILIGLWFAPPILKFWLTIMEAMSKTKR
ncbi:hypothetical protein [Campylobacter helveticus]|uniref:hypothetical protein n=1 Tax=Campylobacter helveticus TaxID=28898 RepID=UPI0022EB1278|nr:hypothetical protein [Campylobacter helveticus]